MLRARVEPTRRRRAAIVVALLGCLIVIASSRAFGRAEPTGDYRPDLPPDALTNGCYPLPDGVAMPFPYQVRTDSDIIRGGVERRQLLLQYDVVTEASVRSGLSTTFKAAGFRQQPGATPDQLRFFKPGVGPVTAIIGAIPGLQAGDIVHGTVTLDLPRQRLASDSPDCANMFGTKRFPPGTPESS